MNTTTNGAMESQLRAFYLDWFNNYLSIGGIAEHHGLDVDDAKQMIGMGRIYHARHVEHCRIVSDLLDALPATPNK